MTTTEPISERRAVAMAFLQRVLPSRGWYFSAFKPPPPYTGMYRQAHYTLEELASELLAGTTDTWFSTASFKDNASSAAANIDMLQAFRLDVDCGKEVVVGKKLPRPKPYPDSMSGVVAVLNFTKAAGLPPPGLVYSGTGVHAWWPLTKPQSPLQWERYAEGLKAACKKHALEADPVVTTDLARILRCPGTFNCKSTPVVEVKLEPHFFNCGPYDISLFDKLLSTNVLAFPSPAAAPDTPASPALYCEATVRHYASMLSAIPLADREDRQVWFETGAALHELGWGDNGFRLWTLWSQKSAKFDAADQIKTWESFARPYPGPKITAGSLAHRAQQHGWTPPGAAPPTETSPDALPFETNEPVQLSTERLKRERDWNLTASGKVKDRNFHNCRIALATLGLQCRYNIFIDKKDAIIPWLGPDWVGFSDNIIAPLRKQILDVYKFDPGKDCVYDVLEEFAIDNTFDPIVDYLNGLKWDGVKRLDTWLTTYLGVENNKLNCCFGLLVLIAAVRRAFRPGTKFDHMLILEGNQGTGKSTVVEILGLKNYYKNQPINFQDPRSIIEALNGAWFYEWAELAGMRRADVERLKSMLSTSVDSARMAYGHIVATRPRRCVIIGTTNAVKQEILADYTGARRYWPVVTGQIKLKELRSDIDQLYAEAVVVEKTYGPLILPQDLIPKVISVQQSRTKVPEWADLLSDVKGAVVNEGTPFVKERVLSKDLITQWLRLTPAQLNAMTYRAMAEAMRYLGWETKYIRIGDKIERGYVRSIKKERAEEIDGSDISD